MPPVVCQSVQQLGRGAAVKGESARASAYGKPVRRAGRAAFRKPQVKGSSPFVGSDFSRELAHLRRTQRALAANVQPISRRVEGVTARASRSRARPKMRSPSAGHAPPCRCRRRAHSMSLVVRPSVVACATPDSSDSRHDAIRALVEHIRQETRRGVPDVDPNGPGLGLAWSCSCSHRILPMVGRR